MVTAYKHFSSTWQSYFKKVKVAYSYKTNSLKGITQALRQQGATAEVVSGTELTWAIEDGFAPREIFFDGPVKTVQELLLALKNHVVIQIDSLDELHLLTDLFHEIAIKPRLSLRLATRYHDKGLSRFGLLAEEYWKAIHFVQKNNMIFEGIHLHVGSNVNDVKKYTRELVTYMPIIKHHIRLFGPSIFIDIGGGFPAKSLGKNIALTPLAHYAKAIKQCLSKYFIDIDEITLVTEPGRSLVEDHGYLVTRVMVQKKRKDNNIVVVDGGMHLVRSLHTWYHPVLFSPAYQSKSKKKATHTYTVYGANCFESDILAEEIKAHYPVQISDLVILGSAGGYDIPSANVWTRPAPAIYGIYRKKLILLRHDQKIETVREHHENILF
ncbi:MAG: hypothetical protein AAF380_01565 [Bacteroidota bacterium]